jgi:phytoene/squalene synthetase
MSTAEATAEVFWTAFRALPKREREALIEKLLHNREFLEDVMDLVILEQRRKEPSRPLEEYLSDRRKKRS